MSRKNSIKNAAAVSGGNEVDAAAPPVEVVSRAGTRVLWALLLVMVSAAGILISGRIGALITEIYTISGEQLPGVAVAGVKAAAWVSGHWWMLGLVILGLAGLIAAKPMKEERVYTIIGVLLVALLVPGVLALTAMVGR